MSGIPYTPAMNNSNDIHGNALMLWIDSVIRNFPYPQVAEQLHPGVLAHLTLRYGLLTDRDAATSLQKVMFYGMQDPRSMSWQDEAYQQVTDGVMIEGTATSYFLEDKHLSFNEQLAVIEIWIRRGWMSPSFWTD